MLLQLSQNVSLTNHTNPLSLAVHPTKRLTKASSAATAHNDSLAAAHNDSVAEGNRSTPRLLQASKSTTNVLQMQRGAAAGWIVFDAMLVALIAVILACCIVSLMGMGPGRSQQPRDGPRAAAVLGARRPVDSLQKKWESDNLPTHQSLAVTAVPPPVICPELILINSEARFRIDMKDLMDENTDYFPILSPSGTTHFEAKIEEGRVLYLYSPGQDTARIMVQSPRSFDIQMMNILDGQGRWFGKIEAMPDHTGLLLFHKNKPSVIIRVKDIASYSMVAEPIVGGGKIATLTSSTSEQGGDSLRCQVKNGVDPVLCLGAFLALIALKPSLLELGVAGATTSMS